jgi:hypothetical protein
MNPQSIATIDKERCLASALSIGAKIASKKFANRFPYWHFDANAGCGWNDVVDVPGSPVVFHQVADLCLGNMRRNAFFCDIDKQAVCALDARLQDGGWASTSYLIPGDNEEALQVFGKCIEQSGEDPQKAVGSVIIDPNGYYYRTPEGVGAPINSIVEFSTKFLRIDIILNLNARTYRMGLAQSKRGQNHHVMPPEDVLASLNKQHWLVRWTHRGGNDWLLAVGRNFETGDHKAIGFYRLESAEGREIIERVKGGRQGNLFDAA